MQKVNLNLIPGSVLPVINVSQYDEGRQFQLAVFNGAASYDLTGKTVVVDVQKTDGHGCEYGAADDVKGVPVVAVSGNIVTITTPQQMTACAGDCAGELKITDSTSTIGTLNFILMCEPAPLNDETIISDTELPDIIDAARSSAARAEDAAQDAEAAATHYPYIGDDGFWYEWDVETEQFVKTDVSAAGRAPDITMTATADATSSPTPTVTVTKTGTDEEPDFALAFSGLKGAKGDKGDTGPVGPAGDIADIEEAVGWVGSNLFNGRSDRTGGGITVTKQTDGKYLVTGTAQSSGTVTLIIGQFTAKAGVTYHLSGFPTGYTGTSSFNLSLYAPSAPYTLYAEDRGNGATFTRNSDTLMNMVVAIPASYVCPANFLWSPMISRNGGAYVPHHPTVQEELWDGEVAEPKNLIKYRADLPKVYTENTVTFTVNDDYSVTVNTSAPTTADVRFGLTYELVNFYPDGKYVLSDVNGSSNGVYTTIWRRKQAGTAFANFGTNDAQPCPFTVNNADKGRYMISLYVKSGKTVNNVTLYPMICTLEDWNKSHDYLPYYTPLKDVVPTKFSSSNVAPTEDGAGVSQAYSTGQYLIHNGELRKATTAIASGAAITDNNTDETTLAEILELNKNELASGICTLLEDSGRFDISNATVTCAVNRFTRRISIKFTGVVTLQQISVGDARAIMNVETGYWGLISPSGIAAVRKDNTYYRAQIGKNTVNKALAFTPMENIPAGASIYGYLEWPY